LPEHAEISSGSTDFEGAPIGLSSIRPGAQSFHVARHECLRARTFTLGNNDANRFNFFENCFLHRARSPTFSSGMVDRFRQPFGQPVQLPRASPKTGLVLAF
jgi:hypothetical protein